MNARRPARDTPRRLRLVPAPEQVANPAEGDGWAMDASSDVVRAVGAATVMRLRADPGLQAYVCPFCDQPPAPTASLIVLDHASGLRLVRLAHPTCSPSAVVRILTTPTRLGHRVRATCWLRPTGTGTTTAVLLVDNQVRAWRRHRAREAVELYVQALEATGFAHVTDSDHLPPARSRLTATIAPTGNGTARIHVTHLHAVIFDGRLDTPDAWLRQARHDQAITVVTGTGVAPGRLSRHATPDDARQFLNAVTAALAAGRAWTATAALSPINQTSPSPKERHRRATPKTPPEERTG
jgi:hypothetical protein